MGPETVTDHPLRRLDGLELGAFTIRLSRLDRLRMSGWRFFSLDLINPDGRSSSVPVVEGIYSLGGKGIEPWIEVVNFQRSLGFPGAPEIDLAELGLDRALFGSFYKLLVPGSHIMVWYEGVSGRETETQLRKGVPPILTSLGLLLYDAGFLSIRDFHLPEGGNEGGRKLWGERPLSPADERSVAEKARDEIAAYLSRPARPDLIDLERGAREAAHRVLQQLDNPLIFRYNGMISD